MLLKIEWFFLQKNTIFDTTTKLVFVINIQILNPLIFVPITNLESKI